MIEFIIFILSMFVIFFCIACIELFVVAIALVLAGLIYGLIMDFRNRKYVEWMK